MQALQEGASPVTGPAPPAATTALRSAMRATSARHPSLGVAEVAVDRAEGMAEVGASPLDVCFLFSVSVFEALGGGGGGGCACST